MARTRVDIEALLDRLNEIPADDLESQDLGKGGRVTEMREECGESHYPRISNDKRVINAILATLNPIPEEAS